VRLAANTSGLARAGQERQALHTRFQKELLEDARPAARRTTSHRRAPSPPRPEGRRLDIARVLHVEHVARTSGDAEAGGEHATMTVERRTHRASNATEAVPAPLREQRALPAIRRAPRPSTRREEQ